VLTGNDLKVEPGEAKTDPVYRFGNFQVDTAEEALTRNGEKLPINRRTFGVLQLLIERAGQIVSKQDFFDTVWADTFVEDNSLTVAMTTLRKLLGDDAKQPKFIENLPRKGYRFIGEVEIGDVPETVLQAKLKSGFTPTTQTSSEPMFRNRKILVGSFAAFLLLLIVALGFSFLDPPRFSGNANANDIESIAVLPFENQNPEYEYLSDGLTESLINNLADLPNLRVISRNSVFQYKKERDIQTIGRDLDVRAILSGRLVQQGDEMVVSAELMDVQTNRQIWGRQYNRKISDLFALQQEISQDISRKLRAKLTGDEQKRAMKRGTENPEAFHLYLNGRYQWNKRANENTGKAIEFFNQAIEKDPTYAMAYVGLANCYLWFNFTYPVTMAERVAMVKAAAEKAIEIDPQIGEVYATLAINSHFNEWDWATADRQYKRAIELSPNYATAHHWYAEFLATEGRFDESFAEYQRALELDPLSMAIRSDLGFNYYYARQPERAIEYLKSLDGFNPNYERTPTFLATIYELVGNYEGAITEYNIAYARQGNELERLAVKSERLRNALRNGGPEGYWRESLEDEMRQKTPNIYHMAKSYGRLGDRDKGLEILEKLVADRSPLMVWLKVSPEFDGYRSDPRFDELIMRVGIPN